MHPIYLDYAASTPVDPRVAERMASCLTLTGTFANPASTHAYGQEARQLVEQAREQVASWLAADASEIIWTSGATESDNLAIKGAGTLYNRKGQHIITMKTEHKAVLDTCQHMEKEGYQVTYLAPDTNGLLSIESLKQAFRKDTVLVSIMHVNNETGVIQNIQRIAEETASRGILFHIDAAQSPGKAHLDVTKIPVDIISLSAHKVYGPKGIGALYLRKKPRVRVAPLIHGGGHEQGMRSGTLATHQIVGMGEAYSIVKQEGESEYKRIKQLREQLLSGLRQLPRFCLHADHDNVVPHILNFAFLGTFAEVLLEKMPELAMSTASACQGKGTEGSYVLRAMGYSTEEVKSSIRLSLGRFTTHEDILIVNQCLTRVMR